jgi:hypothetical protein
MDDQFGDPTNMSKGVEYIWGIWTADRADFGQQKLSFPGPKVATDHANTLFSHNKIRHFSPIFLASLATLVPFSQHCCSFAPVRAKRECWDSW